MTRHSRRVSRSSPLVRYLPGPIRRRVSPDEAEHPAFVQGLLLGALVGAAIAGSTLWSRIEAARRRSREESPADARSADAPAAGEPPA